MLISQLPQNYKEIALSLQEKTNLDWCSKTTDNLIDAFDWDASPQKHDFWDSCAVAKEESDLPELI